jgi:autotransporter-associated beta strand protein
LRTSTTSCFSRPDHCVSCQRVISNSTGTGALTKNGAGTLILGNANTYNGNTTLGDGSLVVSSIGNSTGTTASSADHKRAAGTSVLRPSGLRLTKCGANACTAP